MKNLIQFICLLFISIQMYSQIKTVRGTIADENGLPLPGVNVIVKGTKNGTQTDFDGNYEIKAQVGDILNYTYLGYNTEERTVGTYNNISFAMTVDSESLEEVVITAFGIARTRSLPSEAQIKKQKQRAYHKAISQQISGINTANRGLYNGQVIKGINDKRPLLYIVDGVPIPYEYNSVIQNMNANQIDFVNAMKPSKSKEIFGSAAKNGCVVITTKSGNYRLENDESYAHITENDFKGVKIAPLSTFSIDVDKAAYSNIRRKINNGQHIPVDAVKIEEMINYFNYNYPQPNDDHPFSFNTEQVETPWNQETQLVKIGLQGKTYLHDELPPSNLTFLIDVSGSMSSQNKLPLLKSAFKLLVNQLREQDKVSIVVYAGAAGVVLKPTSGNKKEQIIAALDQLQSGGSTAGGEGIELAYKLAEKHFNRKGNNRVILATDGDFNVGASSDKAMEELIEEKRKSGVFLSVLGFGYGNYKDSKLETLADKGNGNHAYIDTMQEAQKVFGKEFGGTLFTIAKDVKIQVEFNPSKVKAYRLIGYENRLLADEDFIDDTKDAGELGSGHSVTALYEIILMDSKSKFYKPVPELKYSKADQSNNYSDELFTVRFRYKKPDENNSIEMVHIHKDKVQEASVDMEFISAVALFGMQIRKSQFTQNTYIDDVIQLAEKGRGKDENGYRAEFIRLIKLYQNIK